MEKRGRRAGLKVRKAQITLYIIIAIIIVAVVLLFFFWKSIRTTFTEVSPEDYIKNCIRDSARDALNITSRSGGSINPGNYVLFGGEKIEYLCYTNEYYKTCSMQQPLLIEHIESEIEGYSQARTAECLQTFKREYEQRGYSISIGSLKEEVSLQPGRMDITINAPISITKEATSSYNEFASSVNTKLYDMAVISTSILNWEARYGDSETTTYMNYFPDYKVDKLRQDDGTKIYILTERDTGESFKFATRSIAWPAGYSIGELNVPLR